MALDYKPHGEHKCATLELVDFATPPKTRHFFDLYPNKTVKFGRDQSTNDHAIGSGGVSRNHLEFYAVSFDSTLHPMIFVRDRQSTRGTFVNGIKIGAGPDITPGRLLQDGDVVSMSFAEQPRFRIKVRMDGITTETLTPIQLQEVKQFSNEYIISNTVIGTGGSARVHVAYDVKTGQQLACKIHDLATGSDYETRKMMSGLNVSMCLEHPNIANFTRAAKSKHTLYVFEELATGGDLFSMSFRREFYKESEVQWMLRQLLQGVDYLHKKGIVHKDIKTENILAMAYPAPSHRLALTDFGHADKVGRKRGSVGTLGWQAPELLQKDGRHGTAIDMWSIGILAVHLLCGPHEVLSLNTLEEILKEDPYIQKIDLQPIFKEIIRFRKQSAESGLLRQHFIQCCLDLDPSKRMTATNALRHPWLNDPWNLDLQFQECQEKNHQAWKPRKVHQNPIIKLADVVADEEKRLEKLAKLKEKVAKDIFGPLPDLTKRTAAATANEASPYFVKDKYTVTKPPAMEPDAYPGLSSPDGKTKSPSQFCKDMSMHERRRLFGLKGKTDNGLSKPNTLQRHISVCTRPRRSSADKRRIDKSKARRQEMKEQERKERHKRSREKEEELADEFGRYDAGSPSKKRKVELNPTDGKPVNFADPWPAV